MTFSITFFLIFFTQYFPTRSHDPFKKTMAETISGFSRFLFSVMIRPVVEKVRSDDAEVA